jgi:hypothetical protein
MTESPDPGVMAAVDQVHANASRFVDEMLTTSLTELQQGVQMPELFIRLGGTLHAMKATQDMSDVQLLVLTATAVARLAGMHHAVEQLADEHDAIAAKYTTDHQSDVGNGMAAAFRLVSAEMRKLVDDHG